MRCTQRKTSSRVCIPRLSFISRIFLSAFFITSPAVSAYDFAEFRAEALGGLQKEWHAGRALVESVANRCTLGLQVDARSRRIIAVKPPAKALPVEAGEEIVSVNGVRIADGAALSLFTEQLPVDGVANVVTERDDSVREYDIRCAERSRWRGQMLAAIDAALAGDYDACLVAAQKLDEVAGENVGHAKLAYECLQAKRVTTGSRPGHEIAASYFEVYRRLAAPGEYSENYRASVSASVERAANLLRRYQRNEFAERLEDLVRRPPSY